MTTDQLRTKLTERRNELEIERDTVRYDRENLEAKESVLLGRIDELSFALEALDMVSPAPRETKDPVEWMKKQRAAAEKPVQERCIEAIRKLLPDCNAPFQFGDMRDWLISHDFQDRTVRKALGKLVDAGELQMTSDGLYRKPVPPESRAVTTQSSPAESPPVAADGGAGDEDFPIMRRVPQQAIEAAE